IDMYLQSKEYIDTAIIPMLPIAWGEQVKSSVESGAFTQSVAVELERQLKGRVVLFPPFTYLMSEPLNQRLERIHEWRKLIIGENMKHVLLISTDTNWKSVEHDLEGSLI